MVVVRGRGNRGAFKGGKVGGGERSADVTVSGLKGTAIQAKVSCSSAAGDLA